MELLLILKQDIYQQKNKSVLFV